MSKKYLIIFLSVINMFRFANLKNNGRVAQLDRASAF